MMTVSCRDSGCIVLVVKSFSQNLKIRGFVFPNACQAWIRSSSPWCKSAWKHTRSLGRPFRYWDIWMVFAWWEAISGARSPAGRILLDMFNLVVRFPNPLYQDCQVSWRLWLCATQHNLPNHMPKSIHTPRRQEHEGSGSWLIPQTDNAMLLT